MQPKLTNIVSHASTAWIAPAICILLSVAAAYWTANQVEREARLKFETDVTDAHAAIESRIQAYSDILLGVRGLFIASDSVTRDEFRDYVDSLDLNRRYPGVQVIHHGQRIAAAQKQAFEAMVRNDTGVDPRGYPDFTVKPPGDRPEYVIVRYVEPMAGNEIALGLDLAGDAVRLAALDRTRNSGRITASGIIALALDPRRHPGFAMRLPVYRKGMPLATVAQRREAFTGVVSAAFIVIDLMRGVLSAQFLQKIHVRIHDSGFLDSPDGLQSPTPENLLFDSDRLLAAPSSQPVSSGGGLAGPASMSSVDVGGRRWNMYFSARQEFVAPSDRWLPWVVLLGGITISLLLFGLTRSLATVGNRAVTLAESITEDLRRSEAKLAKAQRQTQELIEALPNPVYFTSTDGRYLGVNRAWEKFFGMPRDTFIGKTVHDLYPNNPEVAERLHRDDQALWNRPGSQNHETSITTPNGQRHDTIYYKATFTHTDGSVAGLIGTIVDISERRRAEEALRIASSQLQMLIQSSPLAIYTRDTNGMLTSWNPAAEKMYGWKASEVLGKPLPSVSDEARPESDRLRMRLLAGEAFIKQEVRRRRRDGSPIDIDAFLAPLRDASGNVNGIIAVVADITERKQAEAAAKASEERFRATFDQAAVGIVHTSFDGKYLQVNQKFCEIMGYRESELVGRAAADFTHPDDREIGRQYRQRMWDGKLAGFTEEKRYLRKDGSVIWTNRTVSLARDATAKPLYFIRVIEDITERKEIEERYRATFDNAPVGIMHTAIDSYRILRANRKLCEMLGYTQDELLGMTSTDIVHPDYRFTDRSAYRKPILNDELQSFASERKFVRKDGVSLWVNRTVSLVRNAAGEPLYFIRIVEDIDERKQAESLQAMEHSVTRVLAEAETLAEAIPDIIRIICETLGWHCGSRWELDKEAGVLRCAESWGGDTPEIQEFISDNSKRTMDPKSTSGQGLARRIYNTGQPVWITDISQEKGLLRAALVIKAGLHGAFGFPLLLGDDVLGVMEFFHRDIRKPDDMLMQVARSIGNQIGQFMARKQAEERIRHLANYDELTGLPNRSMFNQQLTRALARARRNDKSLAILFIDLDRFKNINDTLGHEAGDRVLKEVAERLRGCLRESDTVGRLGGDEFVVLIEELSQPVHVAAVAQKILAAVAIPFVASVAQKILTAVAKPFILDAQEYHITASIGISTYPADSSDLHSLLKNADISMYRAKEQGKNNYQFYSAQMNVHTVERLELESSLRRAVERSEFQLHYQPKVDIRSGRIIGMEALVRWQRPDQGLIPPAQFIPLAEETGLIVPIGEWVLKTACARNKSWQEQGLPPLRIAVNLSARQFAQPNLLQDVARVLHETGMDPVLLELEITESMVMYDPERAVELLTKLKAMGVHLAIDDFGTGYSSLGYLKRFPIDSVKIDRSFIRNLPGDSDDAAITQAIIAMAHGLKLRVVAEGVETGEQLSFLRAHGCDEMQGYYFSKPLPEHEFFLLVQNGVAAGAAHSG